MFVRQIRYPYAWIGILTCRAPDNSKDGVFQYSCLVDSSFHINIKTLWCIISQINTPCKMLVWHRFRSHESLVCLGQVMHGSDLCPLSCLSIHWGMMRPPETGAGTLQSYDIKILLMYKKGGTVIKRVSDPMLTRSRGSGAPGVKSYKKVKIFVHRVVPLEIVLLWSRQRQLVTDTGTSSLK